MTRDEARQIRELFNKLSKDAELKEAFNAWCEDKPVSEYDHTSDAWVDASHCMYIAEGVKYRAA